jgi:hypothetical protein
MLGAVPLLWIGRRTAARGSARGLLLSLGMVAYGVYNYAFYLFGAALNVFFLLYVVIFVVSIVTFVLVLSKLDIGAIANCFHRATPVRAAGGYLIFVAIGLTIVWVGCGEPMRLPAARLRSNQKHSGSSRRLTSR